MEYMILEGGTHEELATKVNKALCAGWKPQGAVAAFTISQQGPNREQWMEIWFMQAIIKEHAI